MRRNEYVGCGLYPENVDVKMHEDFRNVCYEKNGTISGIYVNELIKSVENVIKVHTGIFEIVELVDPEAASILTHSKSPHDPHTFRGNAKNDLKRVSINKIPKNTYNKIIQFITANYGTKYGIISHIVNQAMELHIKMEKCFVKLIKQYKKPDTPSIDNDNNPHNSDDTENILNSIKTLNIKMGNIEQFIEEKVKPKIQSTFDIAPKSINKAKKIVKGTIKSYKHENKFEKALNTLENIMKYKEYEFTDKDYHKNLVKLTGQGDMRTVHSDLDMLEADKRIKKMRNNAHGTLNYQFINNNQYHKYNTELVYKKFMEGFKEAFQNINALTVDELNEFIFCKDGLHDAQSQHKRLTWLIDEGLVERHEANPKLLFIRK